MFISYSSETEQQCYRCTYRNRGIDYSCNVAKCKGGWEGYFNEEATVYPSYFEPTPVPLEPEDVLPASPLDVQVGGGHYKDFTIQPVEFCQKNQLNYCEGNIVKYACRHKSKNGVEDVRKIIHYAQLILQLEYGVNE